MIYLIEPHADDVYLSLHHHFIHDKSIWAGMEKTIITVYGNKQRAAEGAMYAGLVKAEHFCLGCVEGGGLGKPSGEIPPPKTWRVQFKPGDTLVFPLGLQHPEHLAVRSLIKKLPGRDKLRVLYYLDSPYYSKQKLSGEILEAVAGLKVVSLLWAGKSKEKHAHIFKSQGRYFFNHPPEELPRFEMVLEDDR